jgi:hypothetical protein
LRVEVDDHRPTAQVREPDALSCVAAELEIRCRLALLDHGPNLYIRTVVAAHETLAVVVIAVAVLASAAGAYAYRRSGSAGSVVRQLLALAQTALIAQVALGLLLLSDDRHAADDLHYAYGSLALAAVLAPWLYAPAEPRRRLLWFAGATLLAGALAVRAFMTGS